MINTNVSTLRKNIFGLLEQAIKYNEVLNISTKDGNAVVISEQDYYEMIETLQLMTMPEMKAKIIRGQSTELCDCLSDDDINWAGNMYEILYTEDAIDDLSKISAAGLTDYINNLFQVITVDPFQTQPTYRQLFGVEPAIYSRRINAHHSMIYQVFEDEKKIKIISLWTR